MSLYMGLDPSTKIGWSIIDDRKIIDYGIIDLSGSLNICQRLNLVAVEIERLIDRHKPDYIGIEDVILAKSGVKTLVLLARINGVIIKECYRLGKSIPNIYIPSEWKLKSNMDLKGNAKKCEVQFSVCKKFKLLKTKELKEIGSRIETLKQQQMDLRTKSRSLTGENKKNIQKEIKNKEKEYRNIEKEIYSLTGISNDVADSIAIAVALKEGT